MLGEMFIWLGIVWLAVTAISVVAFVALVIHHLVSDRMRRLRTPGAAASGQTSHRRADNLA